MKIYFWFILSLETYINTFLLHLYEADTMIQDEIENFPQSQANSSSFRLVKTNETLPSIIEAQVVENISPKKITKNNGEFNEIQTTNSTNVWYLSPSGSETNEISASMYICNEFNILNLIN